ncbi:hypothetical protein U9M48_021055 [Paspalum notatum var. saurae]|uniref:Protein HIRA-like C-terminal domain-containing protein n=1 Tax=Paspalum notatum var. saurae TaxID=547442 RepID=A0AAQ3WSC6_PASNO
MITEKPSWIRHEGLQIFSIDIQPGGLRFATGGGDQKVLSCVRIWSMKPVDKDNANDVSSQRLLATMRDHFGSVNCVRWAKHGRHLASGSDDQVILIHICLVDLSWSPDDSTLASGSLDNTVHIWNMTNGIFLSTSSLVKGVTWDPIGSFIASQSGDKTVIIWVQLEKNVLSNQLGSTFFRRLAWSPCGHFITTTHGFQESRHSAPVLERGKWSATFDFIGHNAPVVVVKFNNSTFPKELGYRLSDSEMDELKRSRYGDVIGRQSNLAESPAQLLLEQASAKQSASKKGTSIVQQFQAPPKVSADVTTTAPVVQNQKAPEASPEDDKKTAGPTANNVNKVIRLSSPVKHREYQHSDDRKRIISEAVGFPSNQDYIPSSSQNQAVDFSSLNQRMNGTRPSYDSSGNCNNCGIRGLSGVTARANITESLVIQKASSGAVDDRRPSIEHTGFCLEAKPVERAGSDMIGVGDAFSTKETEIKCVRGTETLWTDRISGKVTVLAGNANFWAVGCEDGCLQVYTQCGRQAMPAMMMGSAAVFIDCDDRWKLLLITRTGLMYIWDLYNRTCILQDSLASLVVSPDESSAKDAGTVKVISAKLSRCGSPLVVLASRHVFLYDMSLKCWLRIADDCFPASTFTSSFSYLQGGELAKFQIDIGKLMARKPIWSRVTDDGLQTRAHLETQLAASLALKSAQEYRQCLLSYWTLAEMLIFSCRESDAPRLREVCESFLGPPVVMVGSASSTDPKNHAWDPYVLGMKKHKLLREDILPSMASNRKAQRLLNEFMDLLLSSRSEHVRDENLLDALAEAAALATQEKTGSRAPEAGVVEPASEAGTVGTAEATGEESMDAGDHAQPEQKQLPPPSTKEIDVLAVKERASEDQGSSSESSEDDSSSYFVSEDDPAIVAAELGFSGGVRVLGDQQKTGIYLRSHTQEKKLLAQAKSSFCFPVIEKDLVDADADKLYKDASKRAAKKDLDIERGKLKIQADAARKAFSDKKTVQGMYDAARERNEKLVMENEDLKATLAAQEMTISQGKAAQERCATLEKIIEDNAPKISELEDLKVSHESDLKELEELRQMKADYEKLRGESEKVVEAIREGTIAAKEAMSSSLRSLGASLADFDFDEASMTEIFSWLAGHAAGLGDAGHAFGGISAVVALRIGFTGAIEALGDHKDKLRALCVPQYKWPAPEDYEKTSPLVKNISNNFLKSFWGSHGDQLAATEAHRLALKACLHDSGMKKHKLLREAAETRADPMDATPTPQPTTEVNDMMLTS